MSSSTKDDDGEIKTGMDIDDLEADQPQAKLIQLLEWRFLLTLSNELVNDTERTQLQQQIHTMIVDNDMAPFYKDICAQFNWPFDQALYDKMTASCAAKLAGFDQQREEAEKNEGSMEVRDALVAKAVYLSLAGTKEQALTARTEAMEKSVGSASRIDQVLAVIRLGLFYNDMTLVQENITKAKDLVDKGGDWERRNLLKIYEGTVHILSREWSEAAKLFLDSIATFTCYDLMSYERLIFYTVLTSLLACDRSVIRKRVIKAPEVLSVYEDIPHLKQYLESLYRCQYASFFDALESISTQVKRDPFMSAHFPYWFREMRINAYSQFLVSYRSVTMASMAEAFGISVPFLDVELSRFIAVSRLNAKIEKVNGVVETTRADNKNGQYQAILRQGDVLLNRIQKLTKVISY